jgi:RimJ/RimL family protein N-acetyltransferase
MSDRLETPRLVLRRYRDEDLDVLAAMNADPDVMRYIGDGRPGDRAATAAMLAGQRAHWAEHGFGRWAVERRTERDLIGFCGVGYPTFAPEVMPSPEIGWRLARSAWGQGYATEAALASRDHAFAVLGFDHLISLSDPRNVASHRVMAKIGLRRVADVATARFGVLRVDRIERAEWLRLRERAGRARDDRS